MYLPRLVLAAVYIAGLIFAEALRFVARLGRVRYSETWRQPAGRRSLSEIIVLAAVLGGIWILPAVYIFTHWLGAFDYELPGWTEGLGAIVFVLGLSLRWRAQVDLGGSWSPTVELGDRHRLVTHGIYASIRHPLYASLILWAIAQPFLLQSLLAGWGGPLAVMLIWLVRVPAEEKMMLQRFGEEYARYMERTGKVIPRLRKEAA